MAKGNGPAFLQNKTTRLLIGALIFVVILVGGFLMFRGSSQMGSIGTGNPQDLIASALSGTGSVKCEYTGDDGATVTAYVKNGMIRTDITGSPEGDGSFIMKENTTWTWSPSTLQGVMFVLPEASEDAVEIEVNEESQTTADEIAADLERYKDSCRSENVDNAVFEVPSDVVFQDFSQVINDEMQMQMQEVPEQYQQYLGQ